MAPYDSDSSSDDGGAYTTTNTILGYAAPESSGDEISHVGGHPIWLDKNVKPPGDLSKCRNCKGRLSLLLQLNADLQQHFPHDTRRIYIWTCRNKTCTRKPGSVRAFREVRKGQTRKEAKPQSPVHAGQPVGGLDLGSALFGGKGTPSTSNANPFSTTASADTISSNPFSQTVRNVPPPTQQPSDDPPIETFAEKLKLNTPQPAPSAPKETWPEESAFPAPFPFFFLDAYPEDLDSISSSAEVASSSAKVHYDADDVGGANEKDTYESTIDKTFQKFSDIVAQNSEQVLRYEFKGQPLLYSGADTVSAHFVLPHGKAGAVKGIPRCGNCGAARVYELQLTPYLIFELEKDQTMDLDEGMEWGTIIVGTCAENCGDFDQPSFHEEWAGVQWEERVVPKG